MGGSLSSSSITHLNRTLSFDFYTRNLSFFGQVQDYQTIDDAIVPLDEPYRRVPQLLASGVWPDQWLGLQLGFDSELVNFDRDVGVTGWRLNVAPEIALPITRPGWFVKPSVVVDHTRYDLSNTLAGQDSSPDRTLPIASLDSGFVLERTMSNSSRVQTIEPRILFVHVPFVTRTTCQSSTPSRRTSTWCSCTERIATWASIALRIRTKSVLVSRREFSMCRQAESWLPQPSAKRAT